MRPWTSSEVSPSSGEVLVARVESYGLTSALLLSRVPSVLAMFLLGLYVGKRRVLERLDDHLVLVRRVRAWGLGLGLSVSLLVTLGNATLPPISSLVALFFNQALAGLLLAMGYAATPVLLLRSSAWRRRIRPLAATGRMALTNYLLQSLVCTLLFYGYGLGLAGLVRSAVSVLVAAGIYAAQTVFSGWWLRRFRFGPAEWLWRSLTTLAERYLNLRVIDDSVVWRDSLALRGPETLHVTLQ